MISIRKPVVLALAAALSIHAACSGSGGTTAASACADVCNKQQSCGDVDSVMGDQCRTKCSADAQVIDATASQCLNAGDILTATEQCLDRACTDYASCLTTLPACLTGGTTTTSGTGGAGPGGPGTGAGTTGTTGTGTMPTGLACTETMSTLTICEVLPSTATMCPTGATQVPSCPTANRLGSCTIGSDMEVVYFYSTGGTTASEAQNACQSLGNGTWTPA